MSGDTTAVYERLFARRRFGMKPGLDVPRALLARLGNPHRALACLHIAGTNGKGSVAAMLSAILDAAAYRVGRFTSPHLQRFNERFVIGGATVGDDELTAVAERVESAALAIERNGIQPPTFFECATAMAFELFRRAGLQLVVLETGMGGRFDATNVVTPLVAVITRIGLDHCQWLGDSLETIAAEKAGIIKPGRPVVVGAMPEVAAAVVHDMAASCGAACLDAADVSVRVVEDSPAGQRLQVDTPDRRLGTLRLPLGGSFQVENVATAITVCTVLEDFAGLPVPDSAIRDGLAGVSWPGRFQWVDGMPPVIVDGAHNPDAAKALRAALRRLLPAKPVAAIVGMCEDKDAAAFLRELAPVLGRIWTVSLRSSRSMDTGVLAGLARRAGLAAEPVPGLAQAVEAGRTWAAEQNGILLVCGSLFLAGEALEFLGVSPPGRTDPNETTGSMR